MKIFGIGLSKTGTTSLASALQMLGFRTRDYMGIERYKAGDLASLDLDVVDTHDALTDTPIPSFYRELDARYPNSKFILTVRERNAWLRSCKKQFTQKLADKQNEAHRQLFMDLYGAVVFDEYNFVRGYDRFVASVRAHFRDRPQDLLVLDVAAGDGWAKLCPFLGVPQPGVAFPKANVTQLEWIDILAVVRVARQAGAELTRLRPGVSEGLLYRAFVALRGGDRVEAARAAAERLIVKGLQNLSKDVPIISRESDLCAYEARRRWNHFWIVDPLDGEGAFREGGTAFTIDIALVQDGQPIYGVVYQPTEDVAYFGRPGEFASCCKGEEPPHSLRRTESPTDTTQLRAQPLALEIGESVALAMCGVLNRGPVTWLIDQPAREWHTAAAHAVLSGAGFRCTQRDSGYELAYNRPDLTHGAFAIAPNH